MLCTISCSINWICARASGLRIITVVLKAQVLRKVYVWIDFLWFRHKLVRQVTLLLACSLDWLICEKCWWIKLLLCFPAFIGVSLTPCNNLPFCTKISYHFTTPFSCIFYTVDSSQNSTYASHFNSTLVFFNNMNIFIQSIMGFFKSAQKRKKIKKIKRCIWNMGHDGKTFFVQNEVSCDWILHL